MGIFGKKLDRQERIDYLNAQIRLNDRELSERKAINERESRLMKQKEQLRGPRQNSAWKEVLSNSVKSGYNSYYPKDSKKKGKPPKDAFDLF